MSGRPPTAPAPGDVIARYRVLPVVVIEDASAAVRLGAALVSGGLPIAEVTFRTAAAQAAIAAMSADPRMLVGAGTVTTAAQVDRAVAAGARFIVSPGFSASVVRRAQKLDVPVFPGVSTATEIIAAMDEGLRVLKFFPAEACGGLAAVTALAAPFPGVRFIPTGGITEDSMGRYLIHPSVAAIGGSWMVAPKLLRDGRFDEVARLAGQATAMVLALAAAGAPTGPRRADVR